MKRFAFRFARLLRIRILKEEAATQELARELDALNRLRERRAELVAERDGLYDLMRTELASGRFEPGRFQNLRRNVAGYQVRIERVDGEIAKQSEAVAAAQARVAECMRERKVLERIREKDLEAWKKTYESAQNALLDEIAGRAGRRDDAG